MKIEFLVGMISPNRRPFKARGISGNGCELMLPQPPQHLLRCLNTAEIRRWAFREILALLRTELVVCSCKPAAHEEDIAFAEI